MKKQIFIISMLILLLVSFASANLLESLEYGNQVEGQVQNSYEVDNYLWQIGETSPVQVKTFPINNIQDIMYVKIWLEDISADTDVAVYNYITDSWEIVGTILEPDVPKTYNQFILIDATRYFDENDTTQIQFLTQGNPSAFDMWIDKMIISSSSQTDVVTSIDYVANVGSVDDVLEPTIAVHGTEYVAGDSAKVWLQLLNDTGDAINDAICEVDIYSPNGGSFIDGGTMINMMMDGIYYYDFIAPSAQGVYPAIAKCFFSGTQEFEHADVFSISIGSAVSGTYLDTYVRDDIYHSLKEGNLAGTKRINVTYTFNNMCGLDVSEELLTGVSFIVDAEWDSVINDDILLYYYNFNTSNWTLLSNKIISPNAGTIVTNTIDTNNVTTSGIVGSLNQTLFRMVDTNIADAGTNQLDVDYLSVACNQYSTPEYQQIQGSSEAHISKGSSGDEGYYVDIIDYGELRNESFFDGLDIYYTIASQVSSTQENVEVRLPLFKPIVASHILNVQQYNTTSMTWYNISYSTFLDSDTRDGVKITLDIEQGINYQFRVINENYWKQRIFTDYNNALLLNDFIEIACYDYVNQNNLTNFTIPSIGNPTYPSNNFYQNCQTFLNAQYHYVEEMNETFIPLRNVNVNFTLDDMYSLESSYEHLIIAGDELVSHGAIILDGIDLANSYSLALINDPSPPTNPAYVTYFASISTSYLQYANNNLNYAGIVSLLSEINESVAVTPELVWEQQNRTLTALEQSWIGGTEYSLEETTGKVVVRMMDNAGTPVSGATCSLSVYYPNNTLYINASTMTEVTSGTHDGIYYIDFNLSGLEGVHPYAVDCNKLGKNYFLLGSYHVFGNQGVFDYLDSINATLSILDDRTLSMQTTINNTYSLVFNINGSVADVYSLLLNLNQTINNIYTYVDYINASLVDINGTIMNIESVVIDINGSVVEIQDDLIIINTTINTINSNVNTLDTKIDIIDGNVDSILLYVEDINISMGSVLNYLEDINNTQFNYSSELSNIYSLLQIVNSTQVNYSSELADILSYLIDINNTQFNYSSDFDNLLSYLIDINNTQYDYSSDFTNVLAYLEDINNTQFNYSSELSNIYSLLVNVNNTQDLYSTELADILAYLEDINNTQFNYSSDFDNLESYLIAINNTQFNYTTEFNNVLTYLQDINDTQVNYSLELASILSYLDDINNTQVNYTTELSSIINYLSDINNTQFNYSSELADIYSLLQIVNGTQVNYTSDFNNLLDYLVDINNTQYDYSTDFSDIDSLLASLNISNNNIYTLLLEVNSTQFNYSSDFDNLLNYLIDINNTQVDYSSELTDIYSLLGLVNTSNNDIYSLLAQVNSTQVNYTNEFNNLLGYLIDINDTQVNYTTELADIYSLLVNVNNTQDIYSTELADIYSVLLNVNATQFNYSSEFTSVFDYLNNITITQGNHTDDLASIYSVLLNVNNTQVNYTTELADIYALLTNVNNTQFNYSSELADIYSLLSNVNNTQVNYTTELADMYSLLQIINSTQVNYTTELEYITTLLENVNGTQVNYTTELANIYSVLLNVNATQVNYTTELNNVLAYLEDINITTTQAYTLSLLMNTTLFDVYDIVTDMNTTMTDLYAVSLVINSSVADIYSLNQAMNVSLSEIFALNVVMNTSINDINNALSSINTTIENIDNGVIGISNDLVIMNGTINNIQSDITSINTTIENIQAFVITINTTTGTISSNVINIQSSLVGINDSINSLLDGVSYINGTIESIQDDILYINSSQTDMYSLLQVANSTIANNNELLLSLNISCSELGIDIADLNATLNDIYALELVMNDSIWFIENLSVVLNNSLSVINSTTMDTYQLLLSVNTTLVSYYDEFVYLQDLINNQTAFLEIALADVSFFNESEVNASDYYENHTLITQSILETQLMSFEIEILDDPLQGNSYKIFYYFYNEDTGELIKEHETSVLGNGTKQIVISSEGLEPTGVKFQGYSVFARLEMLNNDSIYQSMPLHFVDTLDVYHLSKSPFASDVGLYDVIVKTYYDTYEEGESIDAQILIKNTGDEPDQDTILTYWLEDSEGNRYSESKEQILEVPVGETYLTKSLLLPLGVEDGEFRFVAEYETIVQPKINVYDAIQVADLTIFDKINQRLPVLLKLYRGILLASVGALILLFLLALIFRRKEEPVIRKSIPKPQKQRFKKFAEFKPKQ